MQFFLTYLNNIFGNQHLLLAVTSVFLIFKCYILFKLISQSNKKIHLYSSWLFLILVLIGSSISDLTWIFCIIRSLWLPTIDYRIYLFTIRIAWGLTAIQFQSLALFLEKLVDQSTKFNIRQKIFIIISGGFFCLPIIFAFINFNCRQTADRPIIELLIRNAEIYYLFFILMPLTIILVVWKTYAQQLPRILKKQVKILLPIAILPIWISELLQNFPQVLSHYWETNSYSAVCLSTIFLTFAMYFCTRRVIALRFLNLRSHVEAKASFSFIHDFKDVLEKLSHATTNNELEHITQTLFKESFNIPLNKTHLYFRQEKGNSDQKIKSLVESFFSLHGQDEQSAKILIYDEITFNNFYEKNEYNKLLITFLETIDADIFMPIYEKNNMTAYIIVERHARLKSFYGNTERDEMVVYASYLGNIIHLFQTHDINALAKQEKELKDELYHKHQEINQYKESIRSFLRTTKEKEIGIIFYQNRRFIFGNKAAREMIQININLQEGHHLTKALKNIARQVEEYKAPVTHFALDCNGNKLVLSGVSNLDKNNVIITVYYPEITDIIKKQTELLNDPTKWDYLLYLETTESGKLVNKLIPGSGEMLLNFKINLLQTTLSKKGILLEMPSDDVMATVEIIHHISLREKLYHLKLQGPSHSNETIIKLFGVNPLFGAAVTEKPILEELSEAGTLFIENVHLLDVESQEYLAEFLRYGAYRRYKSNQKIPSTARVICSTNQNLQTLVHEGTFSKELLQEFKKTTIYLPSLLTLSEDELYALAEGFTEQVIQSQPLKNLLELTDADKVRIADTRPVSLHELKNKVQQLLALKSKKNLVYDETQFDPAFQLSDPQLMQAARLGKHALKDSKIMAMLWNKFKSQAKIATFLGVNRSSVNRRCKDYHLNS